MRLFIAIGLPDDIKQKIAALEESLQEISLNAKWVEPANLHLTLKFLGNCPTEKIVPIKEVIATTARKFKSFTPALKEFGFFPNPKRPRVFFIHTSEETTLKSIAQDLEEGLEKIGFPKEDRFKSHITLARFKSPKNINSLAARLKDIPLGDSFGVTEITLFESTLTPEGPLYAISGKSSLTA